MHVNSASPLSGLKPIVATCLFSLFLAGCGGGGGGGGSSSLTSEQQTALAAKTAAGTAQFAQSFAQSQTEDSDSGAGTSAQTSGQVVTRSVNPTDCATGQLVAYDNVTTDDTALDIGGETFPALFSGTVTEADGNQDYYQVRSDCVESNFEIVGSADVALLEVGGPDRTALAYRAGGFPGDYDASTPVDTDGSLDIKTDFSGFVSDMSFRGVMHACNGCEDANLDSFGGAADLDTAASAWLIMSMNFGEGTSTFSLGNSVNDRFTLVSSAMGAPGTAAVDVNGRLAVDNPGNECDFDVTYDTNPSNPIVIEGFDTSEGQMTTGGQVDVTDNSSGETYNVEFDTDGNVFVNGEQVDVSEEEDACTLSSEEA